MIKPYNLITLASWRLGGENLRFCRRFLGVVFIGGTVFLSGCSLLFVAKGNTRMRKGHEAPTPTARDLTVDIEAPVTVVYHTRPRETFQTVSQLFFDDASQAVSIAHWNHLSPKKKLKTKTRLWILNPDENPDLVHLPDLPKSSPISTPVITPVKTSDGRNSDLHHLFAASTPITDPGLVIAQVPRPKENHAFGPGEKLKFEVRALSMLGGYATLEIENYQTVAGRPCMVFTARANSVFPFSTLFPVKDVQSSYFDTVNFLTWKFENHVNEGGYHASNLELYDQVKHTFWHQHKQDPPETNPLAPFSQDLISCFYYFRLLPIEVGKTYAIPTQSGGKNYQLVVQVRSKETVTVPAGTFECFKVRPMVQQDTVFHNTGDIDLWVSTDPRHFPVKIQSRLIIGSFDVDLVDASFPPMGP